MKAFFKDVYSGYSAKDIALQPTMQLTDVLCTPLFTVLYLFVAGLVASPEPDLTVFNTIQSLPPGLAYYTAMGFSITTGVVLYQHCRVVPYPTADSTEMFAVCGKIGRWIFLTRQTLCLQAIHATLTLASFHPAVVELVPTILRETHAMSTLIAGISMFVTVQYYLLVATHPDFKRDCKLWQSRGVPFTFLMHWIHTPCGVFALVDLIFIKQRTLLLTQTPPFPRLMLYLAYFVSYYLALIHVNHGATGHWPYGFLKDLGNSPIKWAAFAAKQFAVLAVFVTIALVTSNFAFVIW